MMEKKAYNILVTGCGGDIGQSIGKILRDHPICTKLVGCDIHDKHAGVFVFEHFHIVDRVDAPNYVDQINTLIKDHNIDVLIPVAEPELRFYLQTGIYKKLNAEHLIMPNEKAMTVGFDKLATADFLKAQGLPFPATQMIGETGVFGFPCIVKSRTGAGSKNVLLVEEAKELQFYAKKFPDFILQQYLEDQEGEFTCGLYKQGDHFRSLIFKRTLLGGFSGYGKVIKNERIEQLLLRIAEKLELNGSINIQLRLVDGQPIVFEINPRFSSTVLFRHMLGFEDVLWCILKAIGEDIPEYIPPQEGTQFYKGFSEFIKKEP